MKLQAKNYNQQNGTINKNQLYSVDVNSEITLVEQHADKSIDRVICTFEGEGEIYFCEEYRPSQIPSNGHKAVDIMVIYLEDIAEAHIYDIKRQFKCDDEIFHYVEQANSTYYDARALALTAHYDSDKQRSKIGVITSNYPVDLINEQKNHYIKKLKETKENRRSPNIGIKKKSMLEMPDLERKVEILSKIADKKIVLEDGSIHDLDVIIMNPIEDGFSAEVTFHPTNQ